MSIKIVQGGALTTVQDAGRNGFQESGFSVSGAMDLRSFTIANILLGNDFKEAVLEATLLGPEIVFQQSCYFSITGADMEPTLNGEKIPMYQAILGNNGDRLKLNFAKEGARSYLAFAGGLGVPEVMGSRSTNLKCAIGGYYGRKLETGDEIEFRNPKTTLAKIQKRYKTIREFEKKDKILRVVLGPQADLFTEQGITDFLNESYLVTGESDRMGYRLEGKKIESRNGADIISDGIAFGAVQVTTKGNPIIMMADRQTTGGYAKIATVIQADLPQLAQSTPGNKIRFQSVTVKQAEKAWKQEQNSLKKMNRVMN